MKSANLFIKMKWMLSYVVNNMAFSIIALLLVHLALCIGSTQTVPN